MKIELVVPDELLTSLNEEPERFRQTALIYLLGTLYQSGQISGGIGAKVIGCDKGEFYRLLSEHGFAVIDYPDEELSQEAEVSQVWYDRVKGSESSC